MDMGIRGKKAIVEAASKGLGKGCAMALAEEGCDLVINARTASELGNTYTLPAHEKVIINVGSVGQPRDRDNRASYVIVDDDTITWRRIPYDFEKTAAKIERIAELEPALAHRIKVGT